jgi:succinate-acetate transporter protein
METQTNITIQDTTANPAPLGLFGFGMTTVLLNLHNAGLYELNSMILAKKKNTFGAVAFISYGSFWLTLVGLLVLPKTGWVDATSNGGMVAYLSMWGLFTGCMFIGTLKLTRTLQVIFGSLTILFILLALGDATGSTLIKHIAGIEGILCGFSAFYTAVAQVLNEVYKKTVLPI